MTALSTVSHLGDKKFQKMADFAHLAMLEGFWPPTDPGTTQFTSQSGVTVTA